MAQADKDECRVHQRMPWGADLAPARRVAQVADEIGSNAVRTHGRRLHDRLTHKEHD